MISLTCPGCNTELNFADDAAGRTGKCRECGAQFRIEPDAAPPVVAKQSQSLWARFRGWDRKATAPVLYGAGIVVALGCILVGLRMTSIIVGPASSMESIVGTMLATMTWGQSFGSIAVGLGLLTLLDIHRMMRRRDRK